MLLKLVPVTFEVTAVPDVFVVGYAMVLLRIVTDAKSDPGFNHDKLTVDPVAVAVKLVGLLGATVSTVALFVAGSA